MHTLDSALALTSGGASGVQPFAPFGQVGSVTDPTAHDPGRTDMRATLVTN